MNRLLSVSIVMDSVHQIDDKTSMYVESIVKDRLIALTDSLNEDEEIGGSLITFTFVTKWTV